MTRTFSPHSGRCGTGTRTLALRLAAAAATAIMLRASIRRSSSSRSASAKPCDSSTAPTARPQFVPRCSRTASRTMMSRSRSTTPRTSGRHTLTTTLSPDVSVAACTWAMEAAAIGSRSKVANTSLGAQLGPQDVGDLRPGHLRGVVLQMAQLGDELGREQVTAGGEHLAQFDERDPAVLQGQPERPGQPGPPLGGGQLRPPTAAQVGQQPAADQDPADLRVAAGPAHLPAQAAQHVQRAGQRAARHQGLGDDQEDHPDQQRDDHAEDHEPQPRQDASAPWRPWGRRWP